MLPSIKIENLTLNFRRYKNPNPALKEAVVEMMSGKNRSREVDVFPVLNNISLDIKNGERLGVIGLNGAGKSTLLKTVARIYNPHKGKISVTGRITPLLSVGTGFDVELSGRENIRLNALLLGYLPNEIKEREDYVIDFSGLREFIDTPIKYYSSGMQAKLAFSVATMIDPEIFLVDEIFATGDAKFVSKAADKMKELFDTASIVLFVSHSLPLMAELCNRAIVLDAGNILFDGDPLDAAMFYQNNVIEGVRTA